MHFSNIVHIVYDAWIAVNDESCALSIVSKGLKTHHQLWCTRIGHVCSGHGWSSVHLLVLHNGYVLCGIMHADWYEMGCFFIGQLGCRSPSRVCKMFSISFYMN